MASRSMGRTASTVGMMEGAFFVSRSDLLAWVNRLLLVNLAKVEQCASGAVYCQILDACHPGTVSMRKVNWMAKSDHEFIPNYKVLQAAFDKNCIEKHIDVDKLIRAKYQDNLEFLQWMKCYWEREGSGRQDYQALQAREGKPMPPWARATSGAAFGGEKENMRPRPVSRVGDSDAIKKASAAAAAPVRPSPARQQAPAAPAARPRSANTSLNMSGEFEDGAAKSREIAELQSKVLSQQEDMQELRSTLDGLERERDYYFRKLRDVEILCTTLQAHMDPEMTAAKLVTDVQSILYAENDEEEPEAAVMAEGSPQPREVPAC